MYLYAGVKQGYTVHNTATERQTDKETYRQKQAVTHTCKQTHRRTKKTQTNVQRIIMQ